MYSNKHSWVHGEHEIVEEVVVLADEEGLHIGAGIQHGEQSREGNIREQELVRMQWIESQQSLNKT